MSQDNSYESLAAQSSEGQGLLDTFWQKAADDIKNLTNNDFKNQELPLARIKKIMKLDDDVKSMMISAEAPVLFAKAAEIFINEITLRAWVHTEDNKRRTLQRNDIAMAITKYDQFDFLIDIVPRDELKPQAPKRTVTAANTLTMAADGTTVTDPTQVQFMLQMAQQQALQGQAVAGGQHIQIIQPNSALQGLPAGFALANSPQIVQVQMPQQLAQAATANTDSNGQPTAQGAGNPAPTAAGGQQVIHLQPGQAGHGPIVLQQPLLAQNGEGVIQLNQAQLNSAIRLQLAQGPGGQFIVQQPGSFQINHQGQFIATQPLTVNQPSAAQIQSGNESDPNLDDASE